MSSDTRFVDVRGCIRCGKDHNQMPFSPLANAIDEWKWWGVCFETGQPVLLCDVIEEEAVVEEKVCHCHDATSCEVHPKSREEINVTYLQ